MQRFIAAKTDQFEGYNQQDSNEFLIYLLDNIHQESKRSTMQSAKPNLKEIAGEYDQVMSNYKVKYFKINISFKHYILIKGYRKTTLVIIFKLSF